jgi:hypothetical protein
LRTGQSFLASGMLQTDRLVLRLVPATGCGAARQRRRSSRSGLSARANRVLLQSRKLSRPRTADRSRRSVGKPTIGLFKAFRLRNAPHGAAVVRRLRR